VAACAITASNPIPLLSENRDHLIEAVDEAVGPDIAARVPGQEVSRRGLKETDSLPWADLQRTEQCPSEIRPSYTKVQ